MHALAKPTAAQVARFTTSLPYKTRTLCAICLTKYDDLRIAKSAYFT